MSDRKKPVSLKFFITLIAIVTMGTVVFSYIVLNYSEIAFDSSGENSKAFDMFIVEGAGCFLKGYSDVLLFLNKIEMSELEGTDYNEMLEIISRAIGNMRQAKKAYSKLASIANITPYNPVIIDRLLNFDYECFQKENGLNRDIFAIVREYLENGDVRGMYARLSVYTTQILNKLIKLKATVERGKFPIVRSLWRLNHQCSEALLFGQYVSEVFQDTIKRIKIN